MVNDGDKEIDIQAGKAVADGDQEGEGKMNILRELGVLKKTSLLRKEFRVKESIGEEGKDIVVPAGKLLHVQCKTDVGFLERKTPMMFQQLEAELPEGISAVDSVVTIKKGINNYFQIPVLNQSKHDIVLRKNTNVGVIEYVKSVIPLQVEQSTSCKSPSVNKTTVTPPDQILKEPSVRPPNKTNSEHQH